MRTRGKKTPTPKKVGGRTPTKELIDGDVEDVTNPEEAQELDMPQSPSEQVKSEDNVLDASMEQKDDGIKVESADAGGEVRPSEFDGAGDLKLKVENEDEEEAAEDEVEDEAEDVGEDEDEKVEGIQVDEEVEDEEEVDYEDEELRVQQEGNETLKEAKNDESTLLEIQEVEAVSGRRKRKRLEVFVGGIDKDMSESDLRSIFEKVGSITEIRMSKNSQSGKNKGYAFVRYSDPSEAKKAISELHGSQVGEKTCRVIPSEENDLLYLGNVNKDWKKEQLVEALDMYKVENLEDVVLLEDAQNAEKNRGYAFLEFTTHKDAMKAFNRLRQRDVVVGGDRTAKVAWAQPLSEPDEDAMSQVKNVFVDGLPPAWDEEQVKERFRKYGDIERVVLGRNRSSSKRKDYGFIDYSTREAALACIEAENNSEVGEGEEKVTLKVRLSKPVFRSRKGGKGEIRGNFPIGKDGKGKVSAKKDRPGKKSSGKKKQKVAVARGRDEKRENKFDLSKKSSLGAKGGIKKKNKFNSPPRGSSSTFRQRKNKFTSPISDQRGSRRETFGGRDPRSARLPRRNRPEEAYMYRRAEYAPEAYRDHRDVSRGRKRGYLDLEDDTRYVEVAPSPRSRPRLAYPETLQVAVGAPQYARIPYYEAPVARAQVVPVNQGVGYAAAPVQPYAIYDTLSGASGASAYSAGGYPYGSVYSNGAEITRAPQYVPSTYTVPPPSGTRYSVPGASLGRYY